MGEFLPSRVVLNETAPLQGCFGRREYDDAAATLVLFCQNHEDRWQPVLATDLGSAMKTAAESGQSPATAWGSLAVFRPDYAALARLGYASMKKTAQGDVIELTERGLARIRRWVRRLS